VDEGLGIAGGAKLVALRDQPNLQRRRHGWIVFNGEIYDYQNLAPG